jgi:hypothetical protein
MNHRETGALRRDLINRNLTVAQMKAIAAELGVEIHTSLFRRKDKLAEALLDAVGRPFDREARDALVSTPVTLYAHPYAHNRHGRRWYELRHDKILIGWRRRKHTDPPVMVPATRKDLFIGLAIAAKQGLL